MISAADLRPGPAAREARDESPEFKQLFKADTMRAFTGFLFFLGSASELKLLEQYDKPSQVADRITFYIENDTKASSDKDASKYQWNKIGGHDLIQARKILCSSTEMYFEINRNMSVPDGKQCGCCQVYRYNNPSFTPSGTAADVHAGRMRRLIQQAYPNFQNFHRIATDLLPRQFGCDLTFFELSRSDHRRFGANAFENWLLAGPLAQILCINLDRVVDPNDVQCNQILSKYLKPEYFPILTDLFLAACPSRMLLLCTVSFTTNMAPVFVDLSVDCSPYGTLSQHSTSSSSSSSDDHSSFESIGAKVQRMLQATRQDYQHDQERPADMRQYAPPGPTTLVDGKAHGTRDAIPVEFEIFRYGTTDDDSAFNFRQIAIRLERVEADLRDERARRGREVTELQNQVTRIHGATQIDRNVNFSIRMRLLSRMAESYTRSWAAYHGPWYQKKEGNAAAHGPNIYYDAYIASTLNRLNRATRTETESVLARAVHLYGLPDIKSLLLVDGLVRSFISFPDGSPPWRPKETDRYLVRAVCNVFAMIRVAQAAPTSRIWNRMFGSMGQRTRLHWRNIFERLTTNQFRTDFQKPSEQWVDQFMASAVQPGNHSCRLLLDCEEHLRDWSSLQIATAQAYKNQLTRLFESGIPHQSDLRGVLADHDGEVIGAVAERDFIRLCQWGYQGIRVGEDMFLDNTDWNRYLELKRADGNGAMDCDWSRQPY